MTPAPKYRAPALDKGLDILELLARSATPMSMTEIAAGVGYSKGEIFRMLQVLEARQYLARSEGDGGYVLTNRLFLLGMERPPNKGLVDAALPVMHRLAHDIQHPCHLVVASEEQIVVVARVDAPGDIGLLVRVGHRRPIAHSTSGLVLFAFQNDDVRAHWLDLLDARDVGYKRASFVRRANQARSAGYVSAPSEAVDGVIDFSAPVLQHGVAVGALAIPFIDRHPARVSQAKVLTCLRRAVEEIAAALIG